MVKHIVLWKIKDSADKQQNIDSMTEMLTALVGKVEGLVSVELGRSFNTASDYDVVLYATLKNETALSHYQDHPDHVKCKEFIGRIAESRACIDYNYEEKNTASIPAGQVPDAPEKKPAGPDITVTFPPKRILEETPYYKTRVIKEDKPTETVPEKPAEKRDYVRTTPVIVVSRPPLWEPEVIESPAEKAHAEAAPVETAPVEAAPAEAAPVEAAPAEAAPVAIPVTVAAVRPAVQFRTPKAKPAPIKIKPNEPESPAPAKNVKKAPPVTAEPVKKAEPAPAEPVKKAEPVPVEPVKKAPPAPAEPVKAAPAAPSAPATSKKTDEPFADPFFNGTPHADAEPAPMRFSSAPDDSQEAAEAPLWFDTNVPEEAPMSFNSSQPAQAEPAEAPLWFETDSSVPDEAPMSFKDTPAEKPAPAPKRKWSSEPAASAPKREWSGAAQKAAPAPKATPNNAQVNPVSTEHSKVVEKTNAFGKKKIDVEVTPLDQRSDTWTCPSCGKIMPNYVGTCGCGEVKPFDFGFDDAPAAPAPAPKAAPKASLSISALTMLRQRLHRLPKQRPRLKALPSANGQEPHRRPLRHQRQRLTMLR